MRPDRCSTENIRAGNANTIGIFRVARGATNVPGTPDVKMASTGRSTNFAMSAGRRSGLKSADARSFCSDKPL
jgi:hypothetical protein